MRVLGVVAAVCTNLLATNRTGWRRPPRVRRADTLAQRAMPQRASGRPLAIVRTDDVVFVQASSERASRAARPPSPTEDAQGDAWAEITARATLFEARHDLSLIHI